jgi:hypothetical protein
MYKFREQIKQKTPREVLETPLSRGIKSKRIMTTKLNENSVKNHIEIEGVILTPKLIELLKDFQEHDNHLIKHLREKISDTISLIATNLLDGNDDACKTSIMELSFIREYLKNFQKP